MKQWTLVDQTFTPDGKILSLHEHDGSYVIRVGGTELMSTRQHASEELLAELACANLRTSRGARILIGGLGFGFTLRAALSMLAADAAVFQVEILDAVIGWNRNAAFPLASDSLADPRVRLLQQDVGEVIRKAARGAFDSIILDVDNGPDALSVSRNARLYNALGLRHMRDALRAGGCVAIWSATPDPAFERIMLRAGFTVSVHTARARPNAGGRHTLFIGRAA